MPHIALENIQWCLRQIHTGKIYEINATDNFRVGRSQNAEIILNSNKASRKHSLFLVNIAGNLLLLDQKSVNGTFVNGTQISVDVPHRVFPGDKISFGVADISSCENDWDKQMFFVVLYTEHAPVQDPRPPEELSLIDCSTNSRGNPANNSLDNNHSSAKNNSTAEAENPSRSFELPLISGVQNEHSDVIEIASSSCEDEKPNIEDVNENFEEVPDIINREVADVYLLSEKVSEKRNVNPNNWLQKVPFLKKPILVRHSNDQQGLKCATDKQHAVASKQVSDFVQSTKSEIREHTFSDLKARDGTCVKTSCYNLKKKNNSKEVSQNVEEKMLQAYSVNKAMQQKESIKNSKKNSLQGFSHVKKCRSEQNSKNNDNKIISSQSYDISHKNNIQEHKTASEFTSISPGRKRFNSEKNNEDDIKRKSHSIFKRKSVGEDYITLGKNGDKQQKDRSLEDKSLMGNVESLKNSKDEGMLSTKLGVNVPKNKNSGKGDETNLSSSEATFDGLSGQIKGISTENSKHRPRPQNQLTKDKNNVNKQVEKKSSKREDEILEKYNKVEKKTDTSAKISSRRKSSLVESDVSQGKKNKKGKPKDEKSSVRKISSSSEDSLLLQLDRVIFGEASSGEIINKETEKDKIDKNHEKEISKQDDREIEKNYKRKKELVKEVKIPNIHRHKKAKINEDDEFIFNNHFGSPKCEEQEEELILNKVKITKSTNGKNLEEENEEQYITNKQPIFMKDDAGGCDEPGTSQNQIKCSVPNPLSDNNNISDETRNKSLDDERSFKTPNKDLKSKKSLEQSFTISKDISVIIDITNDDDDMDVSCSQIFHMSQRVKLENEDDTFQKIKNELAEMDFYDEEVILNPVPINLEDDMTGFENTQDICACLEEGVEANQNSGNNLISNEENDELLKILEESSNSLDRDKINVSSDSKDVVKCQNKQNKSIHIISEAPKEERNENNYRSNHIESGELIKGELLSKPIDCTKPKCVRPPIIEAHSLVKAKKDLSLAKDGPSKKDITNKRKNSIEKSAKPKKFRGSPKGVTEPACYDTKSIQMEFKKRNSSSKGDLDNGKLNKTSIREERRKKLREITDRTTLTKHNEISSETETKIDKGKTVKVLPESKTRRGSFLCESITTDGNTTSKNQNSNLKDSECKCKRPGSCKQPMACPIHNMIPSRRDARKCLGSNATLNKESLLCRLKPMELSEPTSKYNLRRTKSSGDIKADFANINNQLQSVHSHYNLRHSTALDHGKNNVNKIQPQNNVKSDLKQCGKVDPRLSRHNMLPPQHSTGNSFLPPYQKSRNVMSPQANHVTSRPVISYNGASRGTEESSRRLMWTNGGPGNVKRPPRRRLPVVDDVVQKMVHWLPNWLLEQVDIDTSAPVNNPPATRIPPNFQNFEQYYDTFSKLVLLENWQYLFKGFREGNECPKKAKIEHVRVKNNIVTLECITYITDKELKQGQFYKQDDFLLLECIVKDKNHSYLSLSFGYVQKCYKSVICNKDLISVRPDMCHVGSFCNGVPHTKLEFTVLTMYQKDKEVNVKKFPIVKTLANIRPHLMLIRAIKGLVDSPICSKILHPKINEYKVFLTHEDIIVPHNLNAQQRSIVLEAASLCTGNSRGIYCIKGPPGTGKSTVIVNLIFQILFYHYGKNKSKEQPMILLAAPSNTAVDNLLSKLTAAKHNLSSAWDRYKTNIKCVRIGPESSISKELIGYSLPRLAEKHLPLKHADLPEFKAARERNENMFEFTRNFFGDRYGHEIKTCEDLIIEKSNIICTTLNSCINGKLIEAVNKGLIKFTCCIIDEATQCHEVESLLPTILGVDKLVLVGDPKQLNATIMNRDAQKLGFGESLFSRIANNFSNDPRSPIRMLSDQYRMHPEICAFPNQHFYEGKLKSLPNPVNKLPKNIKPYLVFNCEKISDSRGDYTNIDEVNLIKKLLGTIFDMIDQNHKYTVGIISPYNAQKELIISNIRDLTTKNTNVKVTVNTVDSFQGSENDIIVISCVRDSTNSFLQNENRLNVALTRAKQALYIIGNYTLFKECRPLYDLREDAKKRKLLLDIRQNPLTINNFSKYLVNRNIKD